MKQEKYIDKIIKIFWVFIIGSIIGYAVEMVVGFVQNGHFVSRQGLVFGPFAQVYGLGILVYYLIVPKIKGGYLKIFFVTMILGGIVEYLCSYFQEILFGTISWDYSHLLFNINGRTSLLHCTYWGIGGVLFMKYILPLINKIDKITKDAYFRTITALFIIFMLFNISVSSMAAIRQNERNREIGASNNIDVFFDKYYSDEVMDDIYENKIEVVQTN